MKFSIEVVGESDEKHSTSIGIYGDSGVGKSTLLATADADETLIILLEPQGRDAILAENPKAQIVDVRRQARKANVKPLRIVADIMKTMQAGGLPEGIKLVGWDSLTELHTMIKDDIAAAKGGDLSIKDWGTIGEKLSSFLRTMRAVPYDNVYLCRTSNQIEESTGIRWTLPLLEGKRMSNELPAHLNALGYAFRRTSGAGENAEAEYRIMFVGPKNIVCKPTRPLRAIEKPNLSDIMRRIRAQRAGHLNDEDDAPADETSTGKASTDAADAADEGDDPDWM